MTRRVLSNFERCLPVFRIQVKRTWHSSALGARLPRPRDTEEAYRNNHVANKSACTPTPWGSTNQHTVEEQYRGQRQDHKKPDGSLLPAVGLGGPP